MHGSVVVDIQAVWLQTGAGLCTAPLDLIEQVAHEFCRYDRVSGSPPQPRTCWQGRLAAAHAWSVSVFPLRQGRTQCTPSPPSPPPHPISVMHAFDCDMPASSANSMVDSPSSSRHQFDAHDFVAHGGDGAELLAGRHPHRRQDYVRQQLFERATLAKALFYVELLALEHSPPSRHTHALMADNPHILG